MTEPVEPSASRAKTTIYLAQPYVSFGSAVLLGLILVVCACMVGRGREDVAVSLTVLAFGAAVGSVLGTALSPNDGKEVQRFASYWRGLAAFVTGYLASKLGPLFDAALASPIVMSPAPLVAFRFLAFMAAVLIAAKATFSCRSYD